MNFRDTKAKVFYLIAQTHIELLGIFSNLDFSLIKYIQSILLCSNLIKIVIIKEK